MGSAGIPARYSDHMLAANSQKIDGRRIAAFVRYRENAKRRVAVRIGPRADCRLGGGVDAGVIRDEEISHGFQPASRDGGGVKHVARAIAGARASITIEPGVAGIDALPVSTRVPDRRRGSRPFERKFDGLGPGSGTLRKRHARAKQDGSKRHQKRSVHVVFPFCFRSLQ
jgi:hypothetical protein